MSITFTTSTNGLGKDAQGMTLACTQPATSVQPATSTSVSSTGKPTARFSSIREFIHWLALGLFLGCALNMNATVTEYKSNKPTIQRIDENAKTSKIIDEFIHETCDKPVNKQIAEACASYKRATEELQKQKVVPPEKK